MGSNDDRAVTIEGNETESKDSKQIDPEKNRFPCCIVWTPLPALSWFFPCVGHVGICREDGVILDFSGPKCVCVDSFAYGAPTRYLQISKDQCCAIAGSPAQQAQGSGGETVESGEGKETVTSWDDALNKSTQEYQNQHYNMLTCNCHSFVANCLNRLKLQGGNWNVANVAALIITKGQHVGRQAILRTYVPFFVVFLVAFFILGGIFLDLLTLYILFVVLWFTIGSYCSKNLIYV